MDNYYLNRAENKISPKLKIIEDRGVIYLYVERSDGILMHFLDWAKEQKRNEKK